MTTLRIQDYYLDEPYSDLTKKDFTLVGLIKASPKYNKGKKQSASYFTDREQTTLVVKKSFSDTIENDKMVGLEITFDYYDHENLIGFSKTEFKPLNTSEVSSLLRKRRQRAVDYLRASSVGTPIEKYVNTILKHYKTEIDLFIQGNTPDFLEALQNESDQAIVPLLNIVVSQDGRKVKDTIIYQIT